MPPHLFTQDCGQSLQGHPDDIIFGLVGRQGAAAGLRMKPEKPPYLGVTSPI